jgi:L-malate glycosyltransferase
MFSVHIDTATSWRGGQNQVLLTVLGLRALGHRAMLVAHPAGELRRRASEGLEFVPLAPSHELDLKAAWKLSRLLARERPAIVHTHDPHAVAMAAMSISMIANGKAPPLVASRRVDFHLKKNSFSRWKHRQVDLFLASSEAIRQMLVADGVPAERVVTVHEGIDVNRMARVDPANIHAELWLPHDAPVVGNVAALVPHKGQRHLVDAAALVVREVPDARFVVLGEGPLRQALEQQVKHLHLEKHVLLPGFRADVHAMHRAFDLFVMSSETEGLGTSLLDAMAAGKAVVATSVGGIPEVVVDGQTGYLVPPRDPGALARPMVRLLKDEGLRVRMGEAGLARVRARFSVERMVEQTLAAYYSIAGSEPQRT